MPSLPIWQKSPAERAAAFAKAFAGVTPAERPVPNLAQQLRAVRSLIVARRQEGFNVQQICDGLKHEDIGINASVVTIRRMLREEDRKREQRRKARIAALMPKSTTVAPKPPAPQPSSTPRR